jgi:hypothetical protein
MDFYWSAKITEYYSTQRDVVRVKIVSLQVVPEVD